MHVFVTGGSGQTGPTVVADLLAAGHTVTGLARSEASATKLRALGAAVHEGSLDDLDSLRRGAAAADGVLHMGYGGDFAKPEEMMRRDINAIDTFGQVLEGTGKPLIITSGTLVMPLNRLSDETDEPLADGIAGFRVAGERACLALAARGVRAIVVRLAPTVHGPHDHGFIPMLIATARKSGVSAYVDDGANRWPAVQRQDAAQLFRLALEKAPAGSVLHGVAETGIAFKDIAETIGQGLGLPTASLTKDQAATHYVSPFMGMLYGVDAPVSSIRTQQLLGWTPTREGLLQDLRHGDYLTVDEEHA
ncbi:SDR family oxidoreductase [Micromonospora sp. NPDC049366]|uniref:SDR family oxidoreductase n=1 Tax=Micromonospora sp. NPDC049366 TaxID=3364271 RepID=UPI00379D19F0